MGRGIVSLREQARRAAAQTEPTRLDRSVASITETLTLVRDAAGHEHWTGTTRTTDLDVEAERSSRYRGTCADPTCVRPDHQRRQP